ncbi:MAG: hypothetical protein ABI840_03310 [bacterium]
MLSIITLELINGRTSYDSKHIFKKKNLFDKDAKELDKIRLERIENFCILLPPLVTLLTIIFMSILYKIFY